MASIYDEGERVNEENLAIQKQDQNDLYTLLSGKIGRKFVFKILEEGYIFTTTFTKSSQGYVNEGKREAALKWFNEILDLDPSIFAKMCMEFRRKDD